MGRQAYITRLALGRSPYEAPLLSEAGDFILGRQAHEFENNDSYLQQYNERGHPEFRASREASRELRRAKNDVLSTFGVVYKMGRPVRPKKTDEEAMNTVRRENDMGIALHLVDTYFAFCIAWWLSSIRMRVQAFASHSIPLLQIMRSDLRVIDTISFLFAGLSIDTLVGSVAEIWWLMGERNRKRATAAGLQRIIEVVSLSASLCIKVFGKIQRLHLLPANLTTISLIPFTRQSPIQLPTTIIGALTFPPFLQWIHETLCHKIESRLSPAIRRLIIKPDNPDRMSSIIALECIANPETTMPGLQEDSWALSKELEYQFSTFKRWFRDRSSTLFGRAEQDEIRASNLANNDSLTHLPTQAGEIDADGASTATPEPDEYFNINTFDELLSHNRPAREEPEAQTRSRTNTLFTPLHRSPATTPPTSPRVRASLIHRDSRTVTMRLEVLETQRQHAEELPIQSENFEMTPEQGIATTTAEDPTTTNIGHERPAAAIVFSASEHEQTAQEDSPQRRQQRRQQLLSSPGPSQPSPPTPNTAGATSNSPQPLSKPAKPRSQPKTFPHHRTTVLSNFAATTLSDHIACLLTNVLLLPVETLIVRSLASTFLASSSSPPASFPLPPLQVRPLSLWSGGWRYHLNIFALLATAGLVDLGVWGMGTTVAIGLGRRYYGWGKL